MGKEKNRTNNRTVKKTKRIFSIKFQPKNNNKNQKYETYQCPRRFRPCR